MMMVQATRLHCSLVLPASAKPQLLRSSARSCDFISYKLFWGHIIETSYKDLWKISFSVEVCTFSEFLWKNVFSINVPRCEFFQRFFQRSFETVGDNV